MDIQTALSRTHSFSELLPIASQAEAKLSCLGCGYLCVAGYSGTIHIDALASRTLELLRRSNYEFSEAEREPGKRLAGRIDVLYHDIDMQLIGAGCFTKTLNILRELATAIFDWISGVKSVRFEWHGLAQSPNNDFQYYTRTQFQNLFGISPEEAESRNNISDKKQGPPPRWEPHRGMATIN